MCLCYSYRNTTHADTRDNRNGIWTGSCIVWPQSYTIREPSSSPFPRSHFLVILQEHTYFHNYTSAHNLSLRYKFKNSTHHLDLHSIYLRTATIQGLCLGNTVPQGMQMLPHECQLTYLTSYPYYMHTKEWQAGFHNGSQRGDTGLKYIISTTYSTVRLPSKRFIM